MMQLAKYADIIWPMAEQERLLAKVSRDNLKWLVMACERKMNRTRGGQRYLARAIRSNEPHVSAMLKGIRGIGPDIKEKIELAFKLTPNWMDHVHDAVDVEELARHVPLLPGMQIQSTPAKPPQPRTAFEKHLMQELEQLRAELARGRNTPK